METEKTSFRDRPLILDETGKRRWIYAKQPKGKWYLRRTLFGWFCIAFLVLAPIIKINGNPLMLFDIANRKFSIFGNIIWTQDTYILALIMSVIVVFVVLFTVVFGRLWCGWACPQTLFLEMIYRRIEYLFDGNYRKGKKKVKTGFQATIRLLGKHMSFLVISLFITNVFLMWFTGPQKLLQIISEPIREHSVGFMFMMGLSIFYYWIYAFFREQVCTFACPYGRLQGVLLDSKSISVIYDFKRGEPRGAKADGDCINCGQCISVCPTGIDIKNGSQLECINCTACIDECNIVMKRMNRPKNLIRFDSYAGIETGKKSIKNARTYAYSAILIILIIILGFTVSKRTPVDATIMRLSGTLYQEIDSATVSNMYNVKIINKTNADKKLSFRIINNQNGTIQMVGNSPILKMNDASECIMVIKFKKKSLSEKSTDLSFGIYEHDKLLETVNINFIGPNKQ